MNSYERVQIALSFREPDRVPLAEFLIDPAIWKALLPSARDQHDFEDFHDFDVVNEKNFYSFSVGADGLGVDEWGIRYHLGDKLYPHPVKGPIRDEKGLESYRPPDGSLPARLGGLPALLERYKGKRFVSFQMRAFFLWATALCGFEDMLVYMHAEPELAARLFDAILEQQIALARNAIRAGADMILETDDHAYNSGSFVSPEMFRELVAPRIRRFCDAVHEEGGIVIKHTDGDIMGIIDDLVAAGVDGLNSIEPAAGMDLALVKEKYGRKISLWGNFDCGDLLASGGRADVEKAIRDCIAAGAPGGGYVLTSCNTIPPSAKPENYAAVIESARRYGKYPLCVGAAGPEGAPA